MGLVLVLWAWLVLGTAGGESPVPTALAGGQPFAVLWNIPSGRCQRRFGVGLPLADYGIVENQGGRFAGQNITIFYKNKFGLYPYISPQGVLHNGGIPQQAPLQAHLARVAGDVQLHLRPTFSGLAVVDWEEWRPLWARNWGPKRVYQLASQRWAQKRGRGRRQARQAFERAARALMEQTLLLGRSLRPAGLWGFYRFPDCFNGDWAKVDNYTGRCRPAEVRRNDRLHWLWAASAALYPSIYLPPLLPPGLRRRYVHHRLSEALRLAAGRLPVMAYSRLSYRRSPRFLEPVRPGGGARCPGVSTRPHGPLSLQADLEHTIGESAALGTAGVVLWGDMSYSQSAMVWEGQRAPCQQSPLTPMEWTPEPSACTPWRPSVTCTGPPLGTRAQKGMARLHPVPGCTERPAVPRTCPRCAPCRLQPRAPAPGTPSSSLCWASWLWPAWSWPRWPST
ncbi:hyaluronidase-3 isoform X2 [Lagopus leucura]|uniref:hyaluronidase-3 isoform X2 n=1 Tax=Lagopus leucura TaxID=30410 RepID=UPI001C6774AE|nr:hyaluronidase-3 isoform X2 [Lagopus leucura]XP_042736425.1 hyaluronidase-3 isoform X2 [Lagopus leucura]